MMKSPDFFAWLFLTSCSLSQAQPNSNLAFKDVYIGMPAAEVRNNIHYRCTLETKISDEMCTLQFGAKRTIAEAPINVLILQIYDDVVHTIYIRYASKDYFQVNSAMEEKLGKPTTRKVLSVQTSGGVVLENRTSDWVFENGTIRSEQYESRITYSFIEYSSTSSANLFADRQKRKAAKRSADM